MKVFWVTIDLGETQVLAVAEDAEEARDAVEESFNRGWIEEVSDLQPHFSAREVQEPEKLHRSLLLSLPYVDQDVKEQTIEKWVTEMREAAAERARVEAFMRAQGNLFGGPKP